jgi:hypothetical protein
MPTRSRGAIASSRFYYAIFDRRSGVNPQDDEVGGGGVIRGALSRSGPSGPSAVNMEERRALSSHSVDARSLMGPVCHVEQAEGSMPVAGTPQKVLAGHWISRANPTS